MFARRERVSGKHGGPRHFLAAIDIAHDRYLKRRAVVRIAIGMHAPEKCFRHFLHAAAHAHVAGTLLTQRFVERNEDGIDQRLRQIASYMLHRQRRMQREHVEAPVHRVGNAELRIEDRCAGTCGDLRFQPGGKLARCGRSAKGVQHTIILPVAEACIGPPPTLAQGPAGADAKVLGTLHMRFSALALSGSLLTGVLLASCAPIISQRGYLPDPAGEASIRIGLDTKATIQQRLGDPSTQATFSGDAWYYISSSEKQVAFFDPKIESRAILAVHFDKDGKVIDLKHYGLKDGHVIAFESRITPTRGRDITFLEQVLGSTPGVPVGQDTQNTNPGGGRTYP